MKHLGYIFIGLLTAFTAVGARASDLAVSFAHPTNGADFQSPTYLQVTATESSNTILYAEFFANGQSIGVSSNTIAFPGTSTPPDQIGVITTYTNISANPGFLPVTRSFFLYWTPQLGDYTLTAIATDDQGNTATSNPIDVFVTPTPVVSVQASVSIASPNAPGIFTITRTGETNNNLAVPCFLSGTAQDGIDYASVTNPIVIPAGQFSTEVSINPLVFQAGNARAVTLQLYNYLVPGGGGPGPVVPQLAVLNPPFLVGSPSAATVYLKADDRNVHKPVVRITQPGHDQSFPAGSDITITASAFDHDTDVSLVEFFDRATKLGETPATTTTPPGQHVSFSFTWTNAPIGPHLLRARATDSQGKTQVSGPVKIKVLPAP